MINGSPHKHGCTYTALHEIEVVLNRHEIDTEIVYLGKEAIPGCIDCGTCFKTGRCMFNDKVNEIIALIDTIDAIIIGSPVYFSSASGQITAFLDRLFLTAGKTRLSGKLGASIVSCRRGGATATFDQLNKYFAESNMPIITSNYWNQVHGSSAEDVLKDVEGLQTLRNLGENMVWLLKCIKAGEKAGVPRPAHEPKIFTNFIR